MAQGGFELSFSVFRVQDSLYYSNIVVRQNMLAAFLLD